ncbi:MAG: DUF533 domain-containing protein [Acidobacteria bacterium]|nr:DUF533 domain-containing protein [Acidobacteriota bacterium]
MFVRGALGRSGRKRARRAQTFLGGRGGFLTASTVMAAVGVAWGLYDHLRSQQVPAAGPALPSSGASVPPPLPGAAVVPPLVVPAEVARLVRLAVSAANADGSLSATERRAVAAEAHRAGVDLPADDQLLARHALAEIVAGVASDGERRDLYVLAFTIVRADEGVSGAERIYLAQLAYALGLDAGAAAGLERDTSAAIDLAQPAPV